MNARARKAADRYNTAIAYHMAAVLAVFGIFAYGVKTDTLPAAIVGGLLVLAVIVSGFARTASYRAEATAARADGPDVYPNVEVVR